MPPTNPTQFRTSHLELRTSYFSSVVLEMPRQPPHLLHVLLRDDAGLVGRVERDEFQARRFPAAAFGAGCERVAADELDFAEEARLVEHHKRKVAAAHVLPVGEEHDIPG